MDELPAADIDAHMRGGLAGVVLEEHQVAGLQLTLGNRGAIGELSGGGAVQGVAEVAVHIAGVAGAVKAAGAVAAVNIGAAEILLGVVHHLLAQAAAGGGGYGGGAVAAGTGGVLAGDHVIAADIAGDAIGRDLVPAVVDTHDVDHRAVVEGGDLTVAGAGAAAHIQGRTLGLDQAVTDGDIRLGGHVQVLAGHIALHGLVVHLIPAVASVLQNHHGVALGGGTQYGGGGAGLVAEAECVGVDGAHADAGGGGAHHADGGEDGGYKRGAQELGRLYHGSIPPVSK